MSTPLRISSIIVVSNQGHRLEKVFSNIHSALAQYNLDGETIVVDDASQSNVAQIVSNLQATDGTIQLISHQNKKGVGASFWEAVERSNGDAVVMIADNNTTDPFEIFQFADLIDQLDIVVPFIFNTEVRSFFRRLVSMIYREIINRTFFVNLKYTNGTVLFRRSCLDHLSYRSKGFFFQTDILIRLVKEGFLYSEVPFFVVLNRKEIYRSVDFPSFLQVLKGYFILTKDLYFSKKIRKNDKFPTDSLSAIRK